MEKFIHLVSDLDKQIFDESFLQCGDVIEKANGDKYSIIEQNISYYVINHWFKPAQIIKQIKTTMRKLKSRLE